MGEGERERVSMCVHGCENVREIMGVQYVCVCVCEREREREREVGGREGGREGG